MATSLGSITWGSGPSLPCSWSYDRRRSGANMQYRVYGTVNVGGSTRHFGYYIDAYVALDGTSRYSTRLKENSPSQWSGELTFDTGWITVSNKTSGSTSCTITLGTNAPRGNGSWSYTLAVDPAGSTISASNGTLGVAQTITLSRKNSSFTDTVTWSCGSQSGTIATKSSATSFTFTPAISLAAQNTAGTSVPITFTTTTYSGNTAVQSNSVTVTEAIPASVKPSAAVAIDDPTGYATTYGAYVQTKSTLHIVTTPTLSYNSPINSYSVTADGNIYNAAEVTTPVLQNTGAQTVSSVVTDKRGRSSDAAVASYNVLAYSQPSLSACEIHRCDADGTTNPEGHYMGVSFTGTVTPLNNRNSAVWAIRYRVTGASSWTDVPLSSLTGNYSVTHQEVIAAADADTFEVQVTITDDFGTVIAGTGDIPIAFTLMNWRTEGDGMAIGGINTKAGLQIYTDTDLDGELNVSGEIFTQGANATDVVLECKNLLPLHSCIAYGFTYTVDSDGYMTANNTSSDSRPWAYANAQSYFTLEAGDYILHGEAKTPTSHASAAFAIYDSSNNAVVPVTSLQNLSTIEIPFTISADASCAFMVKLYNGAWRFWIQKASITDDTYVPHAMTNRQLTEVVDVSSECSITRTYGSGSISSLKVYKCGHVIQMMVMVQCTSVNAGQDCFRGTLNKYRPLNTVVFPSYNGGTAQMVLIQNDGYFSCRMLINPSSSVSTFGFTYLTAE